MPGLLTNTRTWGGITNLHSDKEVRGKFSRIKDFEKLTFSEKMTWLRSEVRSKTRHVLSSHCPQR